MRPDADSPAAVSVPDDAVESECVGIERARTVIGKRLIDDGAAALAGANHDDDVNDRSLTADVRLAEAGYDLRRSCGVSRLRLQQADACGERQCDDESSDYWVSDHDGSVLRPADCYEMALRGAAP